MHTLRWTSLAWLVAVAPLAAQTQFAESVKTHTPLLRSTPRDLAVGDVNGDGNLDVLAAAGDSAFAAPNWLYLGDGAGSFADATATHLPALLTNAMGAALGDVDGDGDLDAYLADIAQDRLYLNDGSGHFTDATFGRLPSERINSWSVILRDFDGDGDLDAVVGDYLQQRLLLNDGNGVFAAAGATHVPTASVDVWQVVAADIDADGDLDLAFATDATPMLWLNDGAAHFTDVSTRLPNPTLYPVGMAFGDVDQDGDQDLVIANWRNTPTLYLNDGPGTFVNATSGRMPALTDLPPAARLGDVDGDGDLDLVISNIDAPERLLLNAGNATFIDASATRIPAGDMNSLDMALADFDRDGDLDIFNAVGGQQQRLLFNDGTGTFANGSPNRLTDAVSGTSALALGDLDADGDLDLVTGNRARSFGVAASNEAFLNDGRGRMSSVLNTHMPRDGDDTRAVALADVDGDGDLDVVFGNYGMPSKLYLNAGNAMLSDASSQLPATNDHVTALAAGDVDADGDVDLVVGNLLEANRLWLNNGSGTFTDATTGRLPATAFETRAVVLADLDQDGDLDLLTGNGLWSDQPERLYLNDGTGSFADASTQLPVDRNPTSSLAVGDIDGDGDLDLVLGHDDLYFGRENTLWQNNGSGTFTDISYTHMVYNLAQTSAVVFFDFDQDGDLDIVVGERNQWNKYYGNDGTGHFVDETLERMTNVIEDTNALAVGDLDADGDADLIAADDGEVRWENCIYANHLRQIWTPVLPLLGRGYQIDVFSRGGFATQAQSAVLLLGGTPAAIALPPYGTLGIHPVGMATVGMALPAPSGKGSLAFPLPAEPALNGVPFYLQALVLPTADPAQARLTNVLAERFVR